MHRAPLHQELGLGSKPEVHQVGGARDGAHRGRAGEQEEAKGGLQSQRLGATTHKDVYISERFKDTKMYRFKKDLKTPRCIHL